MGDPQAAVMSSILKLLMLAVPAIVLLAAAIAVVAVLLSRRPKDEQGPSGSGAGSGVLWITLVVIGVIVLLGCAGAFVFFMQLDSQPAPPAQVQLVPPQPSGGQPVQKQPDAEEL